MLAGLQLLLFHLNYFKDTHREKAPSNKAPALRKSTNMGVCAVGTLNQLFIRGSCAAPFMEQLLS